MMDIHPLMSSATDKPDLRIYSHLPRFPSTHHNHTHPAMIIDATAHNSSMPVSPKQGETITADGLSKQDSTKLVSSSSWEHLAQKTSPSSSPTSTSPGKSSIPSSLSAQVWSSTSSPPSSTSSLMSSAQPISDKFQTSKTPEDSHCESWNVDKTSTPSSRPSLSTSSASSLPGTDSTKDLDDMDREVPTPSNTLTASGRNCDQPDSSPSPHSLFNSSFDDSDQVRAPEMIPHVDPYPSSGMDTNYERRSRRKPTIEDIVRRVKPPVDAPPYDSEESEIEDDILNEEMMMKMNRVGDEVDGTAKPALRMMDSYNGDERYKNEYRQFTMNRLSRLEAVDGIPEDEKEMEVRSDEDLADAEKSAFYRDIPLAVYNIIHEVKVNAHAMFMKTANFLQPEEAKVRREQYLLQLLSNLRDRCLEEGIKPEIIGEILKDVESEISLINEDFEDMRMKQYGDGDMDAPGVHFLNKPEPRSDEEKLTANSNSSHDPRGLSFNSPTFLNTASSLSSSSSSPIPPTSSSLSSSSPSMTTPPTKDSKPIITTISADGIVSTLMKDENKGPPPPLINGGLPPMYPASNISETAFSPNMFPGNGKMNSWFPGSLLNNMPFYPFNGSGSPLDHALARKFLPFEGKMGDNVDKDYLKCQFCERTFRRQKNLENHIENTHQGKNPLKTRRDTADMYFKCSHCPYTTKHQSNLYVHLRIHTGERPYMCGACGVQYSQSHSLKSHIINKHDGIMSYYIKEKRTRSPRGIGYLSSQVMHDNTVFKLPPPPLLGPAMHHHANLDFVNKAIEMAKSEHAQQQQQMQLHQQTSPNSQSMKEEGGNNNNNSDRNLNGVRMPPPLTPSSSVNSSIHNPSTPPSNAKSAGNPTSSSSFNPSSPSSTPLLSSKGAGSPHPSLFMNGHSMPPFMFGELPPHLRNPNHPHAPHPLFPGLPFPPHSSSGFPGNPGLSPLQGMSPNSASGMPSMAPNLPPGMQMFGNFPHMNPSPVPNSQQPHIKKEPSHNYSNHPSQQPQHQDQEKTSPPASTKRQQSEEAIDLRKRTPPPPGSLEASDNLDHDIEMCHGKENCPHEAKLKYLRLNVVRMLGILVPNLNFAEKGISAESESVDELLQDVIESNVPEEEMME